jgi:hypothetical protein
MLRVVVTNPAAINGFAYEQSHFVQTFVDVDIALDGDGKVDQTIPQAITDLGRGVSSTT